MAVRLRLCQGVQIQTIEQYKIFCGDIYPSVQSEYVPNSVNNSQPLLKP